MPDLTLSHDPGSFGVVSELEGILPEVVIDHMNRISGSNIPLWHVELDSVVRTTPRGGNRYGHRFRLHIQTAMPVFIGDGGRDLSRAVRNDPRVIAVLAPTGDTLGMRVTYVDAVWFDDEDENV